MTDLKQCYKCSKEHKEENGHKYCEWPRLVVPEKDEKSTPLHRIDYYFCQDCWKEVTNEKERKICC